MNKFEESFLADEWEVLTPTGWSDIISSHKTIPYRKWKIKTKDFILECADIHLVFDRYRVEVPVKSLKVGDLIETEKGLQSIVDITVDDIKINMYDIEVNNPSMFYYTNGILSHNTAVSALYLLWYAMFKPNTTILVTSYRGDAVEEIMDRIRFAYENCENYIRCAVTTYNSKKISFDNKSVIHGRTITSNAGRGLSVSLLYCVDGGTKITVKDKHTDEIKDIDIEKLYTELHDDIIIGISRKPKLRLLFTDNRFIDVDEDTSMYINGGIKTTIENIVHGDSVVVGNEELYIKDIYALDSENKPIIV